MPCNSPAVNRCGVTDAQLMLCDSAHLSGAVFGCYGPDTLNEQPIDEIGAVGGHQHLSPQRRFSHRVR